MARKNYGPWCDQRHCTVCRTSWTGKGQCPRCELDRLYTEIAQKDLSRELAGVKLNHIIINGRLDGKPSIVKKGESTLIKFRLENIRREDGEEKKVWVDVTWLSPVGKAVLEYLKADAGVIVRGAFVSVKKGKGFALAIKAHEVELA